MSEINFTIINHSARKELKLTPTEYMVADLIYNLSNNPEAEIRGWCYASKEWLANELDISRMQVHRILNILISKELIEKSEDTKFFRTTAKWYKNAIIKDSNKMLHRVTKSDPDSNKMLHPDSNKMLHYNDITNNDSKSNVTNVTEKSPSYGNVDINLLQEYFKTTLNLPKEDCTQKQSRQYWNLLLKESRSGIDGVKWLIDLLTRDDYYAHNITSAKDLYYKRVKLISRVRGRTNQGKGGGIDGEAILKKMANGHGEGAISFDG